MEKHGRNVHILFLVISGFLLALTVIVSSYIYFKQLPNPLKRAEKVTIGMQLIDSSALLMVAQQEKYFAQEGLDVTIVSYSSGARALSEGLRTGKVDMVSTSEVPIVFEGFQKPNLRIIATIATSDSTQSIIARVDRGITHPKDLKGKLIATQKNSAVHFFLYIFLLKYGLLYEDVTLEFMLAEQLPQALVEGSIDAFSMREPFISQARKKLGSNAVVFSEKNLYLSTNNIVTTAPFVKNRPQTVKKLLRALLKAEEFTYNNPNNVQQFVAKTIKTDKEKIEKTWPAINFRVSLEQFLVLGLEDTARWAIENELTTATQLPDYLKFIYINALYEVKPEVTTIIK